MVSIWQYQSIMQPLFLVIRKNLDLENNWFLRVTLTGRGHQGTWWDCSPAVLIGRGGDDEAVCRTSTHEDRDVCPAPGFSWCHGFCWQPSWSAQEDDGKAGSLILPDPPSWPAWHVLDRAGNVTHLHTQVCHGFVRSPKIIVRYWVTSMLILYRTLA